MTLTLYHFPISVCSEKVRMVLAEKGVTDWESREVALFRGAQFDPDYLRLNPKAVVPTLVDQNGVLTESTLIAEYLDDIYPAPPLKPETAFERAEMRLFAKACDEGLHQGVGVMSFAAMFMDRLRQMPDQERAEHLSRITDLDRRDRMQSVHDMGVDSPYVYRGVVAYEKIFQKIEAILEDGRTWLMGDQFTLAEINLAPYLARLEHMDLLTVWTADRPRTVSWFERLKARASFVSEVVERTPADEVIEMRDGGRKLKARIAEFRDHYLSHDFGAQFH